MAKALKMASVGPVMVTIRSGQFPSEMLIRAPLFRAKERAKKHKIRDYRTKIINKSLRKIRLTSSRIFLTVSPF